MKYVILVLLAILILMQSDSLAVNQFALNFNSALDVVACKVGLLDSFQCAIIDFNQQLKGIY